MFQRKNSSLITYTLRVLYYLEKFCGRRWLGFMNEKEACCLNEIMYEIVMRIKHVTRSFHFRTLIVDSKQKSSLVKKFTCSIKQMNTCIFFLLLLQICCLQAVYMMGPQPNWKRRQASNSGFCDKCHKKRISRR